MSLTIAAVAARARSLPRVSLAHLLATGWPPVAITLLAAALRVYHLRSQSLWLDELDEGTTARASLAQFFLFVRHNTAAPPLDYIGVKAMTTLLGHGTAATRSWALLMGIAAVPLTYIVGRRVFDSRAVGLAAALFLTLSGFHIFYSQEARFYAIAVAVELLNLAAFTRAVSKPQAVNWLVYGATCAVALYSYYFVAFLFPLEGLFVVGLAVWLAVARTYGPRLIEALKLVAGCAAAQALALLLFTPWVLFALNQQLGSDYPRLPDLTPDLARHTFTVLIGLASPWAPATAYQTWMTCVVVVLALTGLAASILCRRFLALVLAAGAVAALPLAWKADQTTHYFWADRQLIIALPLLVLLAAAGYVGCLRLLACVLTHAETRGWLRFIQPKLHGDQVGAAVAGLGLGLIVAWSMLAWPSIASVYTNRWIPKENWWGATAFVSSNLCSTTMLYSQLSAQQSYGIDFYNTSLGARTRFIGADIQSIEMTVIDSRLTPDDWIILHPAGQGGGDQTSLDEFLTSHGWQRSQFDGVTVYHGPVCSTSSRPQ
jgi:uncharacterized membrane protein